MGDEKVVHMAAEASETGDIEANKPQIQYSALEAAPATAANSFNTMRKLVDYSSESQDSSKDSESDSSESLPPRVAKQAASEEDLEESSSGDDAEEFIRPIEEITITAPPEQCKEVGKVKNILNNQVIVEPNVGLAALDLDTVLFLDEGKKPFGRVDDVFGPISEPLYAVLLPSASSVAKKEIEPGMKVFYAPSMPHTTYIFLPDLIKMKGSDASWKHNQEPPSEMQDFSDDEEEAKAHGRGNGKRGGHRQGNARFNKKPNRNFNNSPRARMDNVNGIPYYPPVAFDPRQPPPQFPAPYYPCFVNPVDMMQAPPPPPAAASSSSQQPPTGAPQFQDMRHWNKK